jgi:hypothetical protein
MTLTHTPASNRKNMMVTIEQVDSKGKLLNFLEQDLLPQSFSTTLAVPNNTFYGAKRKLSGS